MRLTLCILTATCILAVACDNDPGSDPEDPIGDNMFVVTVTDGNNTTTYSGTASGEVNNYEHRPDSAVVTGTTLDMLWQLSFDDQIFFRLIKEAPSLAELTRIGTFPLGGASEDSFNDEGLKGMYYQYKGDFKRDFAICEEGTVAFDTFTPSGARGSFACGASQRIETDRDGTRVIINSPIDVRGQFDVIFFSP